MMMDNTYKNQMERVKVNISALVEMGLRLTEPDRLAGELSP
jgi:hypothetical protein